MRMSKVAVVLLVLASFVAAATIVSTAAMTTPTMKPMATMAKPTMAAMPKATKMPTAMPNATVKAPAVPAAPNATMKAPAAPAVKKMFDITPMKSTIGNTYRMLKNTVKMPGKSSTGNAVKSKASQILSDTYGKIGMSAGQPLQLGVPAPKALRQLGALPQIGGTKATIGEAPGANMMINVGLGL